jgi:hypothetical protein
MFGRVTAGTMQLLHDTIAAQRRHELDLERQAAAAELDAKLAAADALIASTAA